MHPSSDRVTITFLGDTYFGEWYMERRERRGRRHLLRERGYGHCTERLAPFLARSDVLVVNLECALSELPSPLARTKDCVLVGDPQRTAQALARLGTDVVLLGNNHALDGGVGGLEETLAALGAHGITPIGAGRDRASAEAAFQRDFDLGGRPFKLAVISGYWFNADFERFRWYAGPERAGVNNLNLHRLKAQIAPLAEAGRFVVLSPHWGHNYAFRLLRQSNMAAWMVRECRANLVLGHGAHMATEIGRRGGVWVLFSIGNGFFNSEGEYAARRVPPFSFIANLVVERVRDGLDRRLELFPIVTDNQATDFQPRFVDEAEFERVATLMRLLDFDGRLFDEHVRFGETDGRLCMRMRL